MRPSARKEVRYDGCRDKGGPDSCQETPGRADAGGQLRADRGTARPKRRAGLRSPPTVLRLFLFGKDNGPNESRGNDGFALKKKVAELFEVFDRERSLSIQELMIDNGLPVRMTVADAVRV